MNHDPMQEALKLAQQAASENEVPVGALVLYQDLIIGKGYNQKESSSNALAHAEMIALQKASQYLGNWRLNECTLIVTLEPCLMCLAACQQARIQKVIYGAPDPKGGALSLGYHFFEDPRLSHRFTVSHQPSQESQTLLKHFFQSLRTPKTSLTYNRNLI